MRASIILALLIVLAPLDAAFAQLAATGDFHIVWEVKNRFRLFRNEADFLRQVAASRGDGVLAAERRLERESDGLGWARDVVPTCVSTIPATSRKPASATASARIILVPRDHPIGVTTFRPAAAGRGLRLDVR
jgi:hypothetical protein